MRISKDFLQRLESLMQERGLNQSELARLLHTPASTITKWRRGSQPQRNTLILLSQVFRVDLDWLTKGTGTRFPQENPLAIEQTPPSNRLEDMGFRYTTSTYPDAEILPAVLAALTTEELLTVAGRLSASPSDLLSVLAEIRQRTPAGPVNYLKPTKP